MRTGSDGAYLRFTLSSVSPSTSLVWSESFLIRLFCCRPPSHTHKKKRNKAAQKEENRSSFFSRGIQSKTGIKRERKGRRRHQNRNQTIPFNGRIERNDSEMRPRKKKTLDRERRKRRPNRKAGAIFYWSRHFSFNSANEMLVLTEEEEEQEKKKDKKRNRERERDTLKTYPRHHTHTYTHTHAGRFTRRAERGHSKAHLIKTRAVSSAWIWQSIFRFFSVFLFVGGGGGVHGLVGVSRARIKLARHQVRSMVLDYADCLDQRGGLRLKFRSP